MQLWVGSFIFSSLIVTLQLLGECLMDTIQREGAQDPCLSLIHLLIFKATALKVMIQFGEPPNVTGSKDADAHQASHCCHQCVFPFFFCEHPGNKSCTNVVHFQIFMNNYVYSSHINRVLIVFTDARQSSSRKLQIFTTSSDVLTSFSRLRRPSLSLYRPWAACASER